MAKTREEWLIEAVAAMEPIFREVGVEEYPTVRVSVGWPAGTGRKNAVIGQCWAPGSAEDGVSQIFISPVLKDSGQVLATLAHEMVHAIDRNESGHRGRFAKIAKAIGLEGKMTATVAGEALAERLGEIAERLGEYPHAALTPGQRAKQSTRMLKVECPETGYKVRLTRKWLEEYGSPKCPCCDTHMQQG